MSSKVHMAGRRLSVIAGQEFGGAETGGLLGEGDRVGGSWTDGVG